MSYEMLQDSTEFSRFLGLINKRRVRSFLEVGSKHGGSLWRVANVMPRGCRVVSIDLPHGPLKASEASLKACVAELKRKGYDAHLFLSDSTDAKTIEAVKSLGPFDCVFIDANHTEPYVWSDWKHYGPLSNMVAFHDIAWRFLPHKDDIKRLPIHVPLVWQKLKKQYEHVEISCCEAANGIGILWRDKPL